MVYIHTYCMLTHIYCTYLHTVYFTSILHPHYVLAFIPPDAALKSVKREVNVTKIDDKVETAADKLSDAADKLSDAAAADEYSDAGAADDYSDNEGW